VDATVLDGLDSLGDLNQFAGGFLGVGVRPVGDGRCAMSAQPLAALQRRPAAMK
jgi:hypothetical protein